MKITALHLLFWVATVVKISGAPVPGVNTEPTPIPVNPRASHEPVSSSCDYKACPILFCYDNATSQTLNCIYDRCFESHLYWTSEKGLTISHTTRNYSHHISHLKFDYSSLPFGYHKLDVFYKHQKYSSLGRICGRHHCSCSFSSILDVSDGVHASQADINLTGRTSKLSLKIDSKKKIDFQNLLRNMRIVLKDIERHRT